MQEKSFDEVVNEYNRRKIEGMGKFRDGRWVKCSMCGGAQSITCDKCSGTGIAPERGNMICPVCGGRKKMTCRNPQCRAGSVWVTD
ncbi:MAG: hypothetical protein FWF18_02025 [Dehalococcoidia bacterium]|nr:hypothetical protein [Dehalococcoidia bacterium]